MTPQHERWTEFYNKLSEAVTRHGCQHGTTHSQAALAGMGCKPDEIQASLAGFANGGGLCDCEILMNCAGEDDGDPGNPDGQDPTDEVVALRTRVAELEGAVEWLGSEVDRLSAFAAAAPQEPCEVCGWPKEEDGRCIPCETAMKEAQREGLGHVAA
jgi:hypothetical protein